MNLTTIIKNCRECGKTFSLTPEEQQKFIDKGLHEPTHCPVCREKRRNIEYIHCNCGIDFELNELEREFYQKKGFPIPKRCSACRRAKRERREAVGNGR